MHCHMGESMTAKITIERTCEQVIRLTLVADIQLSGTLNPLTPGGSAVKPATGAPGGALAADGSSQGQELLTVEETAELLHVGRDKVYYLLRTGQLGSVKIGKLRRISRMRIAKFVERLEAGKA
jgi:excisionase family DNA binding protein